MLFWLWFRFGSITPATLYEMMTDLTQRIKSIESILYKNLLPWRGAQRVVTLSSPRSAPPASVTQDISYTRYCSHPYDIVPRKQPRPHR